MCRFSGFSPAVELEAVGPSEDKSPDDHRFSTLDCGRVKLNRFLQKKVRAEPEAQGNVNTTTKQPLFQMSVAL